MNPICKGFSELIGYILNKKIPPQKVEGFAFIKKVEVKVAGDVPGVQ